MITLRNGSFHDPKYNKTLCGKSFNQRGGTGYTPIISLEKQEDIIINRGGGLLVLRCYNSGENGEKTTTAGSEIGTGKKEIVLAENLKCP